MARNRFVCFVAVALATANKAIDTIGRFAEWFHFRGGGLVGNSRNGPCKSFVISLLLAGGCE